MTDDNRAPQLELAVLGAALTDAEAWSTISRVLAESDFFTPAHARLFDAIVAAEDEGRYGDNTLIAQHLVDGGMEDGYTLIAGAVTSAAPTSTLQDYLQDLRSRSSARQAAAESASFAQQARDLHNDPEALQSLMAGHQERLQEILERSSEDPWESIGSLMARVKDGESRLAPSLPTGFYDLDRVLQGGFRPGQMVTIAGRPAMGKSTMAVDVARYASLKRDIPGLHLTLEMDQGEITSRIASAEAAIPLTHVMNGDLSDHERARIAEISEEIDGAPLLISAPDDHSWGTLRSNIIAAHRRYGIVYAIIDYLQLVTFEGGPGRRISSRQEEIGQISRATKRLAKRLGITIITVAQLNRGPAERKGNLPQMTDLRESGDLEQDSDVVALIHRPDYYDPMSEREGGADLIIAKQRNGPTGTVELNFQGHYSRFVSMASEYDSSPSPYPQP